MGDALRGLESPVPLPIPCPPHLSHLGAPELPPPILNLRASKLCFPQSSVSYSSKLIEHKEGIIRNSDLQTRQAEILANLGPVAHDWYPKWGAVSWDQVLNPWDLMLPPGR